MKSDFLRIIFDIIVLIILAVLIFYIIMVFIGVAMGNEFRYIGYLNSIAKYINDGGNGEVFINNYDYNYVFVLTNYNGWYLQLYHCLSPDQVANGFLSVTIAYWNVSTTDNGKIIIFAPALGYCKLVKQVSLNNINQINISIQGLNDNAGLPVLDFNTNDGLSIFQITINLIDDFFLGKSPYLTILNDTTITCNDTGCTYIYSNGENGNIEGNIYCAPNPNINNNNLTYNASDCVELSGFPQNSQISNSNFEGQIVQASIYANSITEILNIQDFPLLYFAGSLPPTVMDIEINSNPMSETANINIYIGETVST
jgi:hypothetical protein